MSTATRPQNQPRQPQSQAASLLEQILDRPPSERLKAVNDALAKRIEAVEEVLPDSLKSQAARFVKRAQLTFSRKDDLHDCEPASLVRCVVEAAELGLSIDGRLAHAVAYNCKISKKGEPEKWAKIAQLQLDYKGLLAVAKRSGQIVDAWADIVCDGEEFEAYRDGTKQVLRHVPAFRTGKETVVGAYVVIDFGNGRWRFETMGEREIDAVRQKSKAKDRGPWVDFTNEMRKKTVLRRGLKTYCDDPAVCAALDIDDREYDGADGAPVRPGQRVGRSALNDVLSQPPRESEPREPRELVQDAEGFFGGEESQEEPTNDPFAWCKTAADVESVYQEIRSTQGGDPMEPGSDELETARVQALARVKGKK